MKNFIAWYKAYKIVKENDYRYRFIWWKQSKKWGYMWVPNNLLKLKFETIEIIKP